MTPRKRGSTPEERLAQYDVCLEPNFLTPVINGYECPMLYPGMGWFTVFVSTNAMNDDFDDAMRWRRYEGARHGT